jgi:hypothetical protein
LFVEQKNKEGSMHWKRFPGRLSLALAGLWLLLAVVGCAGGPPANVKMVTCPVEKIEWDVAKSAEISEFGCEMGKKGMDPALIFTVGVKNVAAQPQRFRVNIFLLDVDKAAGHLVPRKGKPPQVAAGETKTVKIPFIKTTDMLGKIHVRVAPLSD